MSPYSTSRSTCPLKTSPIRHSFLVQTREAPSMLTSTTTSPISWSGTLFRAKCLPDTEKVLTSSRGPLNNAQACLARGSLKKVRKSRSRRESLELTRFWPIPKRRTPIKYPLRNLLRHTVTRCPTSILMRVRPTAMGVIMSSLSHHKAFHTASSTSTAHIIISSTSRTSTMCITTFNKTWTQRATRMQQLFHRTPAWTRSSFLTRSNKTTNITPTILSNHPTTSWRLQEKDHFRLAWTKWASFMPIILLGLIPTSHLNQDTTSSIQTRSQALPQWEARTDRQ